MFPKTFTNVEFYTTKHYYNRTTERGKEIILIRIYSENCEILEIAFNINIE